MDAEVTKQELAELIKYMQTESLKNYIINVTTRFQPTKNVYELIKKRFYLFIKAFYNKYASQINNMEMTRDTIKFFIREINLCRNLRKNKISELQKNIVNTYAVMWNNGEGKIYHKKHSKNGIMLEVAASEDCFDIIAATLRTEKLSIKDVMSRLSTFYYIPEVYYIAFGKLCMEMYSNSSEIMKDYSNSTKKVFGVCAQVVILNMFKYPDEEYRYILLYVDKETSFIILRPMTTNTKTEVSMELLKIFLDFGPPKIIECSLYMSKHFNDILQIMESIHPKLDMPQLKFLVKVKCVIDIMDIPNLIKTWCEHNECPNWSIGIYMIQWLINSYGVNSPYNAVFKNQQNNNTAGSDNIVEIKYIDHGEDVEVKEPYEIIQMDNQDINNDIVNQRETNINLLLHTEEDLGVDVKVEPDDCDASNLIDLQEHDLTSDFSRIDNFICKVCNVKINEDLKCSQCQKSLHIFCKFENVLKEFTSKLTLTSLCRLCIIVNNRVEELKQSSNDSNKDDKIAYE